MKEIITINKIFTSIGRINRLKYFFYQIILNCISISFQTIRTNTSNTFIYYTSIFVLFICVCLIIAKSIQRLHDINLSGSFYFIFFVIAFISRNIHQFLFVAIVLGFHLFLLLKKGTNGPNKYDLNPSESLSNSDKLTH